MSTTQRIVFAAVAIALLSLPAVAQSHAKIKRETLATICGNPNVACKSSATFQPNDLPFRVPANAVIINTESFYAIILQSVVAKPDGCDDYIPENNRLAAQALFPDHKVFSSRCPDPENLRYEDVSTKKIKSLSDDYRIMAVYAGSSLPEARRFLATVKATGKFADANIRRLRSGFNGT